MLLYEKFRPHDFDHVLGQEAAVKRCKTILQTEGWGGLAWLFIGKPGTGKTTLAQIIADIGCDDFYLSLYSSGRKLTSSDIAEIEESMTRHTFFAGKTGKAFIIDEAHGMRKDVVEKFLGILEHVPTHVAFFFTTTREPDPQTTLFETTDPKQDADERAFISRCKVIRLTNQGLNKVFAAHCQAVARAEGKDGKPLGAYEQLARQCHNNCREMLQEIAAWTKKE